MIVPIDNFGGLETSLANPRLGSAKALQNFVRHRHRGWLEQMDGYGKKFPNDGDNGLPQTTIPAGKNYFDPAIFKMSAMDWFHIHNYPVPQIAILPTGGFDVNQFTYSFDQRNITLVMNRYTLGEFHSDNITRKHVGLFARPYWTQDIISSRDDSIFASSVGNWVATGNQGITVESDAGILAAVGMPCGRITASGVGDGVNNVVRLPSSWNLTIGEKYRCVINMVWVSDAYSAGNLIIEIDGQQTSLSLHDSYELMESIAIEFTATQAQPDIKIWLDVAGFVTFTDVQLIGYSDRWTNLNEVVVGQIQSKSGAKVYIGTAGTFDFRSIDPNYQVFNSSHFIGWTVIWKDRTDAYNYPLIVACGFDGTGYYVQLSGTVPTQWINGDRVFLHKNFMYKDIPTDTVPVVSQRQTSVSYSMGNRVDDISLFVGLETAVNFQISGAFINDLIPSVLARKNGLYLDVGCPDILANLVSLTNTTTPDPTNGVPIGSYGFKTALVLEDYSIVSFNVGDAAVLSVQSTIALTATLLVLGAIPRRAKAIRIYALCPSLGSDYYRLVDLPLSTLVATYTVTLDATLLSSVLSELSVDAGRSVSADGIIRYKTATKIGKMVYAGNVSFGTSSFPNTIFVSCANGDGIMQPDVFVYDAAHIIDVDYYDGDKIIALASLVENILVLKQRGVVLVIPNGQGGYDRALVSRAVGCCSAASVVVFDDVCYWMDYNGAHSYSTSSSRGLTPLNFQWVEDWKALTDAQKEAAISVIDRVNKQWIVSAGGKQWLFDLNQPGIADPRGQEWMSFVLSEVPIAIESDIPGTIDFLTAAKLETLNKSGQTRHDGANYTMSWESNRIDILKEAEGFGYSALVRSMVVQYDSSVPLTLYLYLDDETTEVVNWNLPSSYKMTQVQAPFGCTCKAFRVKVLATTTADTQAVKIKSMSLYYEKMASGGDMVSQ